MIDKCIGVPDIVAQKWDSLIVSWLILNVTEEQTYCSFRDKINCRMRDKTHESSTIGSFSNETTLPQILTGKFEVFVWKTKWVGRDGHR